MWKAVHSSSGLVVLVFVVAVVVLPLLAVLGNVFGSSLRSEEGFAVESGVSYPDDYRARFLHYATVQRPDGTIRDLYVNSEALAAVSGFPDGTIMVIEGFYAQADEDGDYRVDEQGRYLRGEPFEMVHVREKRSGWLSGDFVSEARNGSWNYGSFDLATGQPFEESLTSCFNCHNVATGPEFLYSFAELAAYRETGLVQYLFCARTGRTAC